MKVYCQLKSFFDDCVKKDSFVSKNGKIYNKYKNKWYLKKQYSHTEVMIKGK